MSQITCVYTVPLMGSQSGASLLARMKAVPIDLTLPHAYGLRYSSDTSTLSGNNVVRTMVFQITPASSASASASLEPGNSGSPVAALSLQSGGSGYGAPPVVKISGGAAPDGVAAYQPASAQVSMGLTDLLIINGGTGYGDGDVIGFSCGGSGSSVVEPTAQVASVGPGGDITVLQVLSAGSGLTQPPKAVVTSSGGTGAVLSSGLGVVGISLVKPGAGFTSAPAVSMTPFPLAALLNTQSQISALASFMTAVFMAALNSDVLASTPVVS